MNSRPLHCLILFALCAELLSTALAGTAYDETLSGDFSNSGLTPTVVTLSPGSNIVNGSTGRSTAVDRDYFTINIPAGFGLYGITEIAGTTAGGAVSFLGLQQGAKLTLATNPPNATGLLGWSHYGSATSDLNLLPLMAIPANSSSGFSLPLGAGDYALWIQDFNAGKFNYSFDFQVRAVNPLVNLSGRSFVGTGDKILIGGFVIAGIQPKSVLIRSAGPALVPFGVKGALADPAIRILDSQGAVVASNTGWSTAANAGAISTATSAVGAFAWTSGSADSAILTTLQPGVYTTQVWGASGDTGNALLEIYDADPTPTNKLANSSIRSSVGTGDNVQIVGFVIAGTQAKTVLIRAAGPAIAPLGVTGALADPKITLYDGHGSILTSNTGWGTASNASTIKTTASSVGAFPWSDGSADSAILMSLQPGAYTAVVSGASGDTGVALLEVYAADGP